MGDSDLGIDATRRRTPPPADNDGTASGGTATGAKAAPTRAETDAAAHTAMSRFLANPTTELFVLEKGDKTAIDPKDVTQGHIGDCYVMAPLAGLAATSAGQHMIHDAITEHVDANGNDVYTVKLYKANLLAPTTYDLETFDVPARMTYTGDDHAQARVDEANHHEMWPLVMEDAFAQLSGGHGAIDHGGPVKDALEALTGKEAFHFNFDSHDGMSPELLWYASSGTKVAVLTSKPELDEDNARDVEPNHAYALTGVDMSDPSNPIVKLHNPWNTKEPKSIPYSELSTWFSSIDIGSARDGT